MRRKFPTPQQVDLRYHVDRDARILRLAPDAKASCILPIARRTQASALSYRFPLGWYGVGL